MKLAGEPLKMDTHYTTNQVIERAGQIYPKRVLTVAQITTGLRHGHLTFQKVGNARLYPKETVEQWLQDWVEPSHLGEHRLRVRHMLTGPKKGEDDE